MNLRNKYSRIIGDQLVAGIPFFPNLQNWSTYAGFLVGFDTTELNFGGALVPGLHLFPGGEWHSRTPIWWQGKNPNDTAHRRHRSEKFEVWTLRCGESLAVADRSDGLRLINGYSDGIEIVTPTHEEIARYLLERALVMMTNGNRGINWVRQSLRALRSATNNPIVREIHQQVSALRASA